MDTIVSNYQKYQLFKIVIGNKLIIVNIIQGFECYRPVCISFPKVFLEKNKIK